MLVKGLDLCLLFYVMDEILFYCFYNSILEITEFYLSAQYSSFHKSLQILSSILEVSGFSSFSCFSWLQKTDLELARTFISTITTSTVLKNTSVLSIYSLNKILSWPGKEEQLHAELSQ